MVGTPAHRAGDRQYAPGIVPELPGSKPHDLDRAGTGDGCGIGPSVAANQRRLNAWR